MLNIIDVPAETAGKVLFYGLSLAINAGDVHSIMGPNGTAKPTLAHCQGAF